MADPNNLLQAQQFINAYSAFLKRQGKLPIPGTFSPVERISAAVPAILLKLYEMQADRGLCA